MKSLIESLKQRSKQRRRQRLVIAPNRLLHSLTLERLEERALLAGFDFPDFNAGNSGTLNLQGNASISANNHLRLTPALSGQNGAAWYAAEKQVVGTDWESTFDFKLDENEDSPGPGGSDGFVFVVQNFSPTYLNGGGGTLGYNLLPNSVAIEFDTFQNSENADPSDSHISVHTNGRGPNGPSELLSLGSYTTDPILDDTNVHSVKVTYTPGSMSIYLDDLTTPKLTVSVDLAAILDLDAGQAWLGFTAATGGGFENHDILNWNFDVLADLSTTLVIDDVSQVEGNAGTSDIVFEVSRSGDISGTMTVDWSTADGTAMAGSDYVMASGQLIFNPTETTKTIAVAVNGDTELEPDEDFQLRLSAATGGAVIDGVAIGTILTDDVAISIENDIALEGDTTIRALGNFVSPRAGGLSRPYDMTFHDGQLYVSTLGFGVQRYDALTGRALPAPGKPGAQFVSPGEAGLNNARGLAFGPDGFLYVASQNTNSVLRFDPLTGEPAGLSGQPGDAEFIVAGSAGLGGAFGLNFHDGYLYVTSVNNGTIIDAVLRYDASTGLPAGLSGNPADAVFIASGSGGLDNPAEIIFGPDGMAYVSSFAPTGNTAASNSILRYDPATGAPAGISGQPGDAVFVAPGSEGLDGPISMVFRPDGLYVSSFRSNSISRYSASNGAFISEVVTPGMGGLDSARGFEFDANGNLLVTSLNSNSVLRYGAASQLSFTVTLSAASFEPIELQYATQDDSAMAGSDFVGVPDSPPALLTFTPGETTKSIVIPTIDDPTYEQFETFFVNLTNATGAVIADAQALGTIVDNDVVAGTHAFYNSSTFDGGAGNDDAAISDKTAYRVNDGVATAANYTNYSRGINGIMVDIANLPGTLTAADFIFKVGNDQNPAGWAAAPPPSSIDVRPGEGASGSSRVTITWPDNVIQNEWLEVTVLANANTGLVTPDVHYWGNQIGETGNQPGDTAVNADDAAAVRANASGFASVPVTSAFDINRDGRVNVVDHAIVQMNSTDGNSLVPLNLTDSGNGSNLPGSGSSGSTGGDGGDGSRAFDQVRRAIGIKSADRWADSVSTQLGAFCRSPDALDSSVGERAGEAENPSTANADSLFGVLGSGEAGSVGSNESAGSAGSGSDFVQTQNRIVAAESSYFVPIRASENNVQLNALALAFGLNDGGAIQGGTETALVTGFSLDQSVWDADAAIGSVVTPDISGVTMTPSLPVGATVIDVFGAAANSFVTVNTGDPLLFVELDLSSKSPGDTLLLNPNFANYTTALGPNAVGIDVSSSTAGTLTITVRGDANGNGVLTNADVGAFVLALTDPTAYALQFPAIDVSSVLDFNGDHRFTNADIPGFIAALTSP